MAGGLLLAGLLLAAGAVSSSPYDSLGSLLDHAHGSRPQPLSLFHAGGAARGEHAPAVARRGRALHGGALTHLGFSGADSEGHLTEFSSASRVREETVSLDELPFVLAVTCGGGGIALALAGVGGEVAAMGWGPGTLLVGGAQWGCAPAAPPAPEGAPPAPAPAPAPFYLRVTGAPAMLHQRGTFFFHGGMDVAAVQVPVERVALTDVFHSLAFALHRAGSDLPSSAAPEWPTAPGAAGNPAATAPQSRARRAQLAGRGTPTGQANAAPGSPVPGAPITAPGLRWGTQAPQRKESAVVWNVVPGTVGAPSGPIPATSPILLNAPYGGHWLSCNTCYMWSSVDVSVTASFEGGLAQEMEVTASLRTSSRFSFDLLVNTSYQHAYDNVPYNQTWINSLTGVTENRTLVNSTYLGFINTGAWSVPLTGAVPAALGQGTAGGAPITDNTTLISTLYFSIQGVPLAVPVTLAMSLDISTSWNSTDALGARPPAPNPTMYQTAMLANAGLSLTGTAAVGARYTGESGWTPTRGARGLFNSPGLPAYDIPAIAAYVGSAQALRNASDPNSTITISTVYWRELAVTTALRASVTTTFFADIDPANALAFTSTFNAYTAVSATPGCGSGGRLYAGFPFGPPISLTNNSKNVFAALRKGMSASAAVSSSALPVLIGPSCTLAGCTRPVTATRVYGLFPGPASSLAALGGALNPGLRGGSLQPLPLLLGPLMLLAEEPLPATAYSSGCIPNHKALSSALTSLITCRVPDPVDPNPQGYALICPSVDFVYEVEDFEKDPNAVSASCGSFSSPNSGGYQYRSVRCRGTVTGSKTQFNAGASFIFDISVCKPTRPSTEEVPRVWAPSGTTPPPCGAMQIYPGNSHFFAKQDSGTQLYNGLPAGCENVNAFRQTNGTFLNYTLPLYNTPGCRWITAIGQWGRAACTTSPLRVSLQLCGADSMCSSCTAQFLGAAESDGQGTGNAACVLAGFPPPSGPPVDNWPLELYSSMRATCLASKESTWGPNINMALDGGVTALNPPAVSVYSLTVGAANTVMFIITYNGGGGGDWRDKPTYNIIPQPTEISSWVSFSRQCASGYTGVGNLLPPVPLSCAAVSSINPVETSIPGGTYENGCPYEQDPKVLQGIQTRGCLARIITVPVSQSSPSVNFPIESAGKSRAYLNINHKSDKAIAIQGIAWTRASSLEPLSVVHTVLPMEHLFYSYKPASGILGLVILVTQIGRKANGTYPEALLMARSYEVGLRPAWPRRWEAGLENVVTGLPILLDPKMLPYVDPLRTSATLGITRLIALDLDPSPTDTTGSIVAEEQLFTVANTGTLPSEYLVQAFDLMPAYGGIPNTLSLLGGGRVAYIVTPAETGAKAVNVTLWLQPGGLASACISPGVGTFDFAVCTKASLGRRVFQLTIRESHPAWSAGGMTVTVMARSEATFTLTITPFVPLEPGETALGTLPYTGGLMFGGVSDGPFGTIETPPGGSVDPYFPPPSSPAQTWPGNVYSGERSAYTALVAVRTQADTGGEIAAYSGAGAAYQRSPPGPTGYDQALKNIDPQAPVGQYLGNSYSPPSFMPPAVISVWGFGSAIGSFMGGEYGPQPSDEGLVTGVPGLARGEDTTGLPFDGGLPNPFVTDGGAPGKVPGLPEGIRRAESEGEGVGEAAPLEGEARAARLAELLEALRLKRIARRAAQITHPLEDPENDPELVASGADLSTLPARKLLRPYTPKPSTSEGAAAASAAAEATSPAGRGTASAAAAFSAHHHVALVSHATARALQTATGAGSSLPVGLTPGLAPIKTFYFARMTPDAELGSWVEMYNSGAGCAARSVGTADASLDSFLFLSYGLITCTGLPAIPDSGLELLIAVPPNTALRVQLRSPLSSTPGLSSSTSAALASGALSFAICSALAPWPSAGSGATPEGTPGFLAYSSVGCSNPTIGAYPWTDMTACAVGGNSTGKGPRFVRVSVAPEYGSVGPGSASDGASIPGATLLIASTFAGVDACPTYTWSVGNWGPCSDPCNPGVQSRNAYCIDSRGVQVSPGLCPTPSPTLTMPCMIGPCVLVTGAYGECAAPCKVRPSDFKVSPTVTDQRLYESFNGWAYRTVKCVNKGGNGGQVPDGYCGSEENIQLQASAPCRGPDCSITPVYINSPWGPCSAPCGGGIQARTIMCGTYLNADFSLPKKSGANPGPNDATFGSVYDLVYGDPDNPNGQQFVETQWCDALGLVKGVTTQACNSAPCVAPEVTLSYADVRTLHPLSPYNSTVASLVVPAGSRRYFSLPLEHNRPANLGICINVQANPRVTAGLYAPPTCSEKAIADLGSCSRTLDYCLAAAQERTSLYMNYTTDYYMSYSSLWPGRAPNPLYKSIPNFRGSGSGRSVCACYTAAQQCLALRACTPAFYQTQYLSNITQFVADACANSVCGQKYDVNGTICRPIANVSAFYAASGTTYMREKSASVHIYASWQLRGSTYPSPYAPGGSLPSTRANSDLAAVPVGFYTSLPIQGLPIQPSEIPANAYGLVFSVASPSGGFAGTLTASVLRPDKNLTFLSDLFGGQPPDAPMPVIMGGNLSQGVLYNYTRIFTQALSPGQPARPNVTSLIPSFSWNDTNLLEGGLTLTLNLTCGAWVDPDVAGAGQPGYVNTSGLSKLALLAGFSATRLELQGGQPPLSAVNRPAHAHGFDSILPYLLNPNITRPLVTYSHLDTLATLTLPSLAGTGYAPSADEVLSFTIPGHLLTSGRDLPVTRFRIRINATLGSSPVDCLVGPWGAWTGCAIGFTGGYANPPPSCGAGTASRSRAVLAFPTPGGKLCPVTVQVRPCSTCDPCALVRCYNGGQCIGGACVCGLGYGGADCSMPPPHPVTCRAVQKGPWTSCVDFASRGLSNRTLQCPCFDGSLSARGRPGSAPLPAYPSPADSATATPTPTPTTTPVTGSDTGSITPSMTPTASPTSTTTLTAGLNSSDSTPSASLSPTTTPASTVTPSSSPTRTATLTATPTPSMTQTTSNTPSTTNTRSWPADLTQSRTPSQTPTHLANASAAPYFTWAPAACGNIPVPPARAPCPLGFRNASSVEVFVAVPNLNASYLLAHINVWDAWSTAFAGQLADYIRVPRTQLRMLFATNCPPPPLWLGTSPQLYYQNAFIGFTCLQLEFVQDPSSSGPAPEGSGITLLTFLYRLAAAIGARGPPGNMGDYMPIPLGAAGGPTPQTYLLTPLWTNSWGLDATLLMAIATWQIQGTPALPRGVAAPTIVPGQPFPGRLNGRLLDLGGIQPTSGVPSPPSNPNFQAMIVSLAAMGSVILFSFAVLLPAVRYFMSARAPRPERHKAPRRGSSLPERPALLNDGFMTSMGSFWATKRPEARGGAGAGGSATPSAAAGSSSSSSGSLSSMIAMNPLNVLGGRQRLMGGGAGAGSSGGGGGGSSSSSSSASGGSGSTSVPIELEGDQEVVGYNPQAGSVKSSNAGSRSVRAFFAGFSTGAGAGAGAGGEVELPNVTSTARSSRSIEAAEASSSSAAAEDASLLNAGSSSRLGANPV